MLASPSRVLMGLKKGSVHLSLGSMENSRIVEATRCKVFTQHEGCP